MNNRYYSIYPGIIIQNNDPEHAGQVKVWVPSISPTVYENFINLNKNISVKLLGINVNSELTSDLIDNLKIILPWAPLGLSISNEGSTGRYNNYANVFNSGDGNNLLDNNRNDINFSEFDKVDDNGNIIQKSEKPGAIYEHDEYKLTDAFDGSNKNVNNLNINTFNYKPSTYSNKTKGEFGIPNVGAHVIVQFLEGNPQFPVVTHLLYGKEDWGSVYSADDYPGSYENKLVINGEYNHNVDKYRSKYVFNQRGGSLEINNTDNNEKIKLTHYSGSFKEFNNNTNTELAVNNDQKLVLGNKFETIKGSNNIFTYGDSDINTLGDQYTKIGNLNYAAFETWKNEMAQIADYKQLFHIRRCNADNIITNEEGEIIARFNAKTQSKSGTPAPSPNIKEIKTCIDSGYTNAKDSVDGIKETDYRNNINPPSGLSAFGGDIVLHSNNIQEVNQSSMDGVYMPEPLKQQIQQLYQEKLLKLIDVEKYMGIGGSDIKQITKDKIETIGMVMNDYGSIRIDSVGKMYDAEMKINSQGAFSYAKPSPLIEYVNVQSLPGGSYTLNVCDRFNVLVGAGGFNLKSYGTANIAGTITNIAGEQVNIGSNKEINIESDNRICISAEILTLRQKNKKQILVDSTLGVSRNVIIGGSTYIEGELYTQHVTAPCEYQVTEEQVGMAGALDVPITAGITSSPIPGGSASFADSNHTHTITITNPNCIKVYPHSHIFKNLPLTLTTGPAIVRDIANINLSGGDIASSYQIQHKYKEAVSGDPNSV